jgi:hypothetical protein
LEEGRCEMSDKNEKLSFEIEKLKFEYERLHTEKIKNTNMSYQMMAIFIPTSAVLLTYIFKNPPNLKDTEFLSAIALISVLPLIIAYLIDRRLTYTNQIINARIEQIEKTPEFKMWIARLFNEKDCKNDNPALKEIISEKKKVYRGPFRIYEILRVHNLFGIYIILFSIFLMILIFENIDLIDFVIFTIILFAWSIIIYDLIKNLKNE